MKKLIWMWVVVMVCGLTGFAQENYTEGPVWNVTTIRVKPAHMDDYLMNLRQGWKLFCNEAKRQGDIMDCRAFLKQTRSGPQDWDIALAVLYKNHAQMDGQAAKFEALRDKLFGGKQPAQQAAEKRTEIREILTTDLLQEIMLK